MAWGQLASPVLAQSPKRGGILSFAVTAEPPNYDCHGSQTFTTAHTVIPFYSYLVKFDTSQGSKIAGDLAKSWTISPDGLVYTFELHDNVKFHDGSALTSADVKATFERIARPPEGVVSMRASNMDDVESIETPSPTTDRVPSARREYVDARQLGVALQLHLQRGQTERKSEVPRDNGDGLRRLSIGRASARLLHRGQALRRLLPPGRPYLDGFKAMFVKSNAVVPGMLGGQFDAEFRGRTPAERDQLMKASDKWVLHEGPWSTNNIVIFNTTKKPFDDARVRQALSLAIDRRQGTAALSRITFVKSPGGFLRPGYEFALPEAEL